MWNKFFFVYSIPIAIILSIVSIFNFYIDPYHLRATEGKDGLNRSRIYSADRERALKPLMYLREKPEAVILGNSKSAFSISPEKTAEILKLKDGFNLSVRSATPSEIYELLKFAVNKNKNLKRIIICLDFEMMGQSEIFKPGFSTSLLNYGYLPAEERFSSLLSLSTFCDSVITVRANKDEKFPVIYNNNGEISSKYLDALFKKEGYFNRNSDIAFIDYSLIEKDNKKRNDYFKYYERDTLILYEIKNFLTRNNIKYTLIILPLHNNQLTAINNHFYMTFQEQIKKIFPKIYDLSLVNTEEEKLYYDAAHPKKEFTTKILRKVFANEKIETTDFRQNVNLAKGERFFGDVKVDGSVKTNLLSVDTKLLKYNVLHFTGDANIESADAYFLVQNENAKFLFKATRYGEAKSQNIFNILLKKYERYYLDGRGITDNLTEGKYSVYLGVLRNNIFITDGIKIEFALKNYR